VFCGHAVPQRLKGLRQFGKEPFGWCLQRLGLLRVQRGDQLVAQPDVLADDAAMGVKVGNALALVIV
jgi:hypothetical protein